ncbi:S49 family peptidase [Xanthobacter sp. VTT E-85241]|uniref:S49 family peptidase n=1 Tax=Roseixanthobacter finlandensis TaxID=3119922 RepID=UPI003727C9C1
MDDSFLASLQSGFRRLLPARWRNDLTTVPVVRLSGTIGMSAPFQQSLTLAGVAKTLDRAFAVKKAPAVALIINSPGGAPVQSHLIHKRIRALAEEKEKHVFAFVEDVAASGGYMIACAADEIFVDPSSVVGSIGVISAGFGFDKLIERFGIERRVHTAGTRKMMLDPFQPEREEDVERLKALQREIHQMFADLVRRRRGPVLSGEDEMLFSGEFWAGAQALSLGLADGIGDLREILQARYGRAVRTPLITAPGGWLGRRVPGVGSALPSAGAAGAGLAQGLAGVAEERALWARYGL